MTASQIKQAWILWQEAHTEEAQRIRERFVTKAIEHGFRKAERYLVIAMMERLHVSYAEVVHALS